MQELNGMPFPRLARDARNSDPRIDGDTAGLQTPAEFPGEMPMAHGGPRMPESAAENAGRQAESTNPPAAAAPEAVPENSHLPDAATADGASSGASGEWNRRFRRKDLEWLAFHGASLGEIMALLGWDKDRLLPAHRREFRRGRARFRLLLRRQQLALLASPEPDLRLVFMLGKEYLEQGREKSAPPPNPDVPKQYINIRPEEL